MLRSCLGALFENRGCDVIGKCQIARRSSSALLVLYGKHFWYGTPCGYIHLCEALGDAPKFVTEVALCPTGRNLQGALSQCVDPRSSHYQ